MKRLGYLGITGLAAWSSIAPVYADIDAGIAALESGDAEAAAFEFQTVFDNGNADGAFYLGRMFELGLGTDIDVLQAVELYKVAASGESPLGLNRLGLMHFDGQVVIRDYAQGAEMICKAADLGELNAQFNCGAAHADGRGLPQDQNQAIAYWRQASDNGHIAATNFLGLAYKNGDGIDADPAIAFELFSRTANEGNAMGLFEIALAHQTGEAVELDLVKAYTFSNIAAAQSHPDAPALRDQVEAQLTKEEIDAAQLAAREWMAAVENGTIGGDEN